MRYMIGALLLLSLTACSMMPFRDRSASGPTAIRSQDFLGYQPIAPLPARDVTYYDNQTGTYVDKPWASLPDRPEGGGKGQQPAPPSKLSLLPIQSSYTYIINDNDSGSISYLANTASLAIGNYTVISDYIIYRVQQVKDLGVGLVGVGMRVRAKIKTNTAGLKLGGFLSLALEAQLHHLSGELQVDVIGLSSKDIVQIFPAMTTEISPTSIAQVMQALAAIKSKIYDPGVTITPHLLALQQSKPDTGYKIVNSLAYAKGLKKGTRQLDQIQELAAYVGTDAAKWKQLVNKSALSKELKAKWGSVPVGRIKQELTRETARNAQSEILPKLYMTYRILLGGSLL